MRLDRNDNGPWDEIVLLVIGMIPGFVLGVIVALAACGH